LESGLQILILEMFENYVKGLLLFYDKNKIKNFRINGIYFYIAGC
jgi:hypothetical protein